MLKGICCPLAVLIALPFGVAAHESQPPDTVNTGTPGQNQHQKHSTNGKSMRQDTMHSPDSAGEPDRVLEFTIVGGTLGDDEQTIRVAEGDVVEFRWSSDQELTLHMHGYDIEAHVAPNSHTIMRGHAVKSGRFPILNHDGEPPNVLLYLEVVPK